MRATLPSRWTQPRGRRRLREELRILVLHGLLHLAGEDHETDSGQMAMREHALRKRLRLDSSLIERAGLIERGGR